MKQKIHFILTGGTIDKIYDPIGQINKLNEKSTIPAYIQDFIHADIEASFESPFMMDSLDITPPLRERLVELALNATDEHIIMTHGTDTMTKTAEAIAAAFPANSNKKIVLTGALIPISGFAMSDGTFNIGFAMAAVQLLEPGVYVCMHGRVFPAGQVHKNLSVARFEEKHG
jgi:L-asparaginase